MNCRMSIGGAECAESGDPRRAGTCYRCDAPIARPDEPIQRNLELEREIIREASRGVVDPDKLIEHAQRRANHLSGEYVADHRLIAPGKDRLREAKEEAVDGVNHCLFWLQTADYEDERRDDVMIALRFFALAYDRLTGI